MIANLLQEFAAPLSTEQVNKVKDALGDLSLEQVNWLSGYLAGLAATGSAVGLKDVSAVVAQANGLGHADESPSAAQLSQNQSPGQPISKVATVLYASQTGNARGVAEKLYQQLQQHNIEANLVDLAEYNPKQLKKEQRIFLITSTHGEGEPPDDAIELFEFVQSKKAPDLSGVEFAVLSLGDSSYEFFCQTGKDFDAAFETSGATRLFDRVDCDVDYLKQTQDWSQSIIEFSQKEESASSTQTSSEHQPHLRVVEPQVSKFDKFNPYSAKVLDVISITARGSDKPTIHVEIDLEGSGLEYAPGDALGVWPVNHDDIVNETLSVLEVDSTCVVQVDDEQKTLSHSLKNDFELTQVTPAFVRWIAEKTQDHGLLTIVNDREQLARFIVNYQVPELLRKYSVKTDAQSLLEHLRRITPRLYSIASSQKEVDEEVHLTVGLVNELRDGIERKGAASFLLSELEADDTVKVFVERNKNFKLPQDDNAKIIMIGAGTGIAPYRGFIQERAANKAKGESWLIFGNPHFATDFLYQVEWQQYLKKNQLRKIDLAFSRDQQDKIYVQDRVREQAEELYQWINDGAHIYLCGNKDRLGKSIDDALIDVIAKQGNLSAEDASIFLNDLKKSGRYQKDVY